MKLIDKINQFERDKRNALIVILCSALWFVLGFIVGIIFCKL